VFFVEEKEAKQTIFLVVLLVAIVALVFLAYSFEVWWANLIWLAIGGGFIFIVWKYDFILQLSDYERAVISRFGIIRRVGGPGWTLVIPIIEKYKLIDLRTKTIDVPPQDVVTKDSVNLVVDAIIYLKVRKDKESIINSIREIDDYVNAATQFVVANLRDVIGELTLSEVISSTELINSKIKGNLAGISNSWGISIEAVEIKDVEIPDSIVAAMNEEKASVQQKLARMERALAHKAEIMAVQEAASTLGDKALAYYYIKAIEGMSKSKGSKVFFPAEFSKLAEKFSQFAGVALKGAEKVGASVPALTEIVANTALGSKPNSNSVVAKKSSPVKKRIAKKGKAKPKK
jgi:regulator of protease activity HflC (stomatin/prohibitin superfamily)